MNGSPLLHTPEEAALLLGIGRTAVYQFIASGQLRSVKIGRRRRIPASALDAFVDELCQSPEAG